MQRRFFVFASVSFELIPKLKIKRFGNKEKSCTFAALSTTPFPDY